VNILVIGGCGREHLLAWELAQSSWIAKVFVAPGNAGTAREPGLANVALSNMAALGRVESVDFDLPRSGN